MKKLLLLFILIFGLAMFVSCAEQGETSDVSQTASEANHIKILLGAVAADKSGATEIIEITRSDGRELRFSEVQVLEKGEFETMFAETYGYDYADKSENGTDKEKSQAKIDRNKLLKTARENALSAVRAACNTHGAVLLDDEKFIYVYDSDRIISEYGYMLGVLVYVNQAEAAALRADDAVLNVSDWRGAFFYNSTQKAWELYELE